MSLIEYRIDGTYDKEQHAIEVLQAFCPKEGYYVAFSGGKDSVCIKALCDLAGVKYDAHYRVTSIDPPELVQFIKRTYPDVAFAKMLKNFKDEPPRANWKTPEDVMEWWLSDRAKTDKPIEGQMEMEL